MSLSSVCVRVLCFFFSQLDNDEALEEVVLEAVSSGAMEVKLDQAAQIMTIE